MVEHLDKKLQTTGINSTGWTQWLHKSNFWIGGKTSARGGVEFSMMLKAAIRLGFHLLNNDVLKM